MKLLELFESRDNNKHLTFCFGRMNPPTIGHKQMFDTMQRVGGDYNIFLSQTKDKRENPLDYSTKIKFIELLFPEHAANLVVNSDLNTIVKVASFVYDQGYHNATFVAGDDRLGTFKKLLSDYNGVEGKSHGHYKFDTLNFVSCGQRCPDGDGLEGVSASRAREEAKENNLDGFIKTTGAGQYAEALFHAVRDGLGIKDTMEEGY